MNRLKQLGFTGLKWLEKYTKTDVVYLSKGSFWSTLSQVVVSFSTFLLAIAFAHFLSKETYGQYKYILSIAGILSTFTLTGLGLAMVQSVSRGFEGTLHYAFWQNIKWSVLFFILSLGSSGYYFWNGNSTLGFSLLFIGCLWPFFTSTNLYSGFLSAKKDFRRNAIYFNIIGNLVPYTCLLITIILTNNPLYIVIVYIVSNTFIGVILYQRIVSIYKPNKQVDFEMMNYSKHLSLMGILSGISENIDQVLVFHFIGPAQLAVYNFATAIPNQIKGPLKNLGVLILPKFTERPDSEIRAGMLNKIILLFLGSIVIITTYIIAAPYIFHVFFPKYTGSIIYSQIFSLSLLWMVSIPANTYLAAKKKVKEQYMSAIYGFIVQILFLSVGVIYFGILGLVVARVIIRLMWSCIDFFLYIKASKDTVAQSS